MMCTWIRLHSVLAVTSYLRRRNKARNSRISPGVCWVATRERTGLGSRIDSPVVIRRSQCTCLTKEVPGKNVRCQDGRGISRTRLMFFRFEFAKAYRGIVYRPILYRTVAPIIDVADEAKLCSLDGRAAPSRSRRAILLYQFSSTFLLSLHRQPKHPTQT
jgi:hypothetical protein